MGRALVVSACVALLLLGAATACGAPAAIPASQNLPAAEATNVRRTAVAAVQRIIANNPAATATAEPTPTAAPTCQNALWWTEARSHVGESRTIQGPVVGTRPAPNGTTLLELGLPYPDPTGFAVLVPGTTDPQLNGKNVCVAGRIARLEGTPTMQLRDVSALVVVVEKL